MENQHLADSFENCLAHLNRQAVIAYPTEAVFGLGCDPDSESAVMALLALKQRPVEKGLILIAADYTQLEPYISARELSVMQRERMFACWPGPVTFVVPVPPQTPRWLTGQFDSLAGEQYLYCVLTPRFAAFMNLMAERAIPTDPR